MDLGIGRKKMIKPLRSSPFPTFSLNQTPLPAPSQLPWFLLHVMLSPCPAPSVRWRAEQEGHRSPNGSFLLLQLDSCWLPSAPLCVSVTLPQRGSLMVPQGCCCSGVGDVDVSGPQPQSLRCPCPGVDSCSPSGDLAWNLSCPEHTSSHMSLLQASQTISSCLLSLLADALSYVCSSRNALRSSDQLKV